LTAFVSSFTVESRWIVTEVAVATGTRMESIARFCGQCSCGCPELWVNHEAPAERRIVITDDFGQRIEMSVEQLRDIVADVKSGRLDELLETTASPASTG
jgi:hypothetical protein